MKRITAPDIGIPECDSAEYSNLPVACKSEHIAWKTEFDIIVGGSGRLADRMKASAERMGVSPKTVRHKWDSAHHCGWRGVIDRRRQVLAETSTVPPAFWEWVKALMETEQRSCRQAWTRVVTLWRAGKPITGYDVPPPSGISGVPDGWSYANWMRHAPTKFELKAARIGRNAASLDRPLIMTTRVGLAPGKIYMFDDVWHDVKVNFVGVSREAIRPMEMCCLDLASASKIYYGMLPRIRREDGSRQHLSEREMRMLVVAVLSQQGYRPDGTLLTVEHGTAAIRPEFATRLDALTGGAVRVVRGGIQDASLVMGGWAGPNRGDFKLKASLESLHGLAHNALGLVPGQTGSNSRINQPEKLSGIEAYNQHLLRQVEKIPRERAQEYIDQLKFNLMHWHEYATIVADVYRWLDNRTCHDLEGWEQNCWTTQEFRLSSSDTRWLPASSIKRLPPAQQDAVLAVIQQPGCMRIRRLSPAEVWQAGKRELVRLRPEAIPSLLGEDLAQEKRLDRHHCFTVGGQEYGGAELRFPAARVKNVLGQDIILDPRHTYQVFSTPFDTSKLYICDTDFRYLGTATRQHAVSRADLDAIHRAIGQSEHDRVALESPLRARHASEADDKAAMIAHNNEVLAAAMSAPADTSGSGTEHGEDQSEAAGIEEALRLLEQASS